SFRASEMFEGEAQILSAIAATETVRVPRPIATGDFRTPSSSSPPSSATTPNNESHRGSFIIMEHLQLRPFAMMDPANQEQLGRSLAQLHLVSSSMPGVQFGFNSPTRLGVMPLVNVPLSSSWPDFFLTHRLQDRLDRVLDRFGDEAWELRDIVPSLIEAAKRILTTEAMAEVRPSLLHGDLWVGNAGVLRSGEAVMFDPAGFYGHSEFDLAFRGWKPAPGFPGFSESLPSPLSSFSPLFLLPSLPSPLSSFSPLFLLPSLPSPLSSFSPLFLLPSLPSPLSSFSPLFLLPSLPSPLSSFSPLFLLLSLPSPLSSFSPLFLLPSLPSPLFSSSRSTYPSVLSPSLHFLALNKTQPHCPPAPHAADAFYSAYHEVIPKAAGFEERQCVYQLFHLLNHVLICE
ncbi:unnamed protein product, partial [Closterium sp. NIES-64]